MFDIIGTEVTRAYDSQYKEYVAVIQQQSSFWGKMGKRAITQEEYNLIGKVMGWK